MQTVVLGLLLAAVFGYFVPAVQNGARRTLQSKPRMVWAVPALLAAVFAGAAALAGTFDPRLILMVLVYLSLPVACVWAAGRGPAK